MLPITLVSHPCNVAVSSGIFAGTFRVRSPRSRAPSSWEEADGALCEKGGHHESLGLFKATGDASAWFLGMRLGSRCMWLSLVPRRLVLEIFHR